MTSTPQANAATFVLLVIHGVILWFLIPIGFIGWLLALPWVLRRSRSLGQFLGWLDLNVTAAFQRIIPRMPQPHLAFIAPKDMSTVTYRIKPLLDLW